MQFVSLIETVIVFIQEVIKMMKINKLSAFILAGALTCTAPAMVYADQTTDAAVDQAVELLEQSGVDDLLSDPDKVVDLIISAKETLGTVSTGRGAGDRADHTSQRIPYTGAYRCGPAFCPNCQKMGTAVD